MLASATIHYETSLPPPRRDGPCGERRQPHTAPIEARVFALIRRNRPAPCSLSRLVPYLEWMPGSPFSGRRALRHRPRPDRARSSTPGHGCGPRIRQSNAISLPGALGATRRPSTPASGDEPSSPFSAFYRAVPGPTARPAGWRVILSLCHRPPPFPYHYKCPFDLADLAMARISRHAGDDTPPKYSWL